MLENALRLLADYEPTISSLVGLLTLCAAVWGLFRLRVASRQRRAGVAAQAVDATSHPRWQTLFDLGLSEHSRLEEFLAVRTVNVVLFCLLLNSLPWLLVCLLVIQSATLTIVNLVLFTCVLLGFALQRAGATTAARWLVIIVATLYWLSLMLIVGPMQGLEYLLAGLMVLPVLILSRAQTGQRVLSVIFIVGVFALSIALTGDRQPAEFLDGQTLAIGYQVIALILAAIIFASVSYYKRFAATSYGMLSSKKRENEALVSRLVPSDVASEMTSQSAAGAQWHPEGTMLVGVVTGFSELYSRLPAIELVAELDALYSRFDELVEGKGVEKVKTLGTSYVAAACVRDANGDHAAIAESALAMREIVSDFAREHDLPIGFRCGIATGLTISGVIGKSRPRFDIWGEALDAATTLQAEAGDGEILANETAFWRLKNAFSLVRRDGPDATYALLVGRERDELAS